MLPIPNYHRWMHQNNQIVILTKSIPINALTFDIPVGEGGGRKLILSGGVKPVLDLSAVCELYGEETETELNFLFKCNKFENIRTEMQNKLGAILQLDDDIDKFISISNKPYVLSNFIGQLWNNGNDILNTNHSL